MRLFLLLLPLTLLAQENKCPGYVFDKQISNFKFTGQCGEEGTRVWGVSNYEDGGSFQGLYDTEGSLSEGIYTFGDGDYFIGSFSTPGTILDKEFETVGTYVFGNGIYVEGYFDERVFPIGFGAIFDGEEYYMGMMSGYQVDGVAMRRILEPVGTTMYATYTDGKLNGTAFFEYDDGSSFKQYFINGEEVGERQDINSGDAAQLAKMKEFISTNYAELTITISNVESSMEEYYQLVDEADAEIEATTTISKFASKRSLIVKSIQELLTILGYVPGRADGILGPLTTAAIQAFIEDQNIETNLEADEKLLVELQKQVRRESNADNTNNVPSEPVLGGTGTGFYVTNDILVTNQHVVDGCVYMTDAQNNPLEILTVDRINDLAILRSPVTSSSYIYLDEDPDLGEVVYVAGFPYDLDTLNFTTGAVSALVGPQKNITQFQFTAPVQPGNSGGPILDTWGSLIGVTFARIDDMYVLQNSGTLPQNINYGIRLDVVRDLLLENNIRFREGRNFWFQPTQEKVAQLAKDTTILLNCYK